MTTDPVAVALKFGFLIVLYLFLLWVARSSMRDMTRSQDASIAAAGRPRGAAARRTRSARGSAAAPGGGGRDGA